MNKRLLTTAIAATGLALVALLLYSLERTAWLFGQFETWSPAAYAAAVVVELSAVALIVGAGALSHLDVPARAWANRALGVVLSVGALANLSAGYLRGGQAVLATFGGDWSAYAVAASLWLTTNLAVPALVFFLSKLLERLVAARGRTSITAQRRTLVVQLVRALRAARADHRSTEQLLEEARAEAEATADILRMESARFADELRDLGDQVCMAEQEFAAIAEQTQQARTQSAQLADELRMAQDEVERLSAQLAERSAETARLSAELAAQSAAESLDVRSIAQALRDAGVPLRTIAAGLGVSEKTIRNWTVDVRTNGHVKETA